MEEKNESTKEEKIDKAKELMQELKDLELSPEELEKVNAGSWGKGWTFPPSEN